MRNILLGAVKTNSNESNYGMNLDTHGDQTQQ